VLLHGFQLSPSDYATTAAHLASWGYAVVAPQFPGSAFSPVPHTELAAHVSELIDDLAAGSIAALASADGNNVGLAGHSMGGKVALLAAANDARPAAVAGIDPVDEGGGPLVGVTPEYPSVAPELMGDVDAPMLLLGETTNAVGGLFGPACAPAADNFQQYYAAATSPALQVEFLGAFHMSFLDNPSCLSCLLCAAGTDDPAVTRMHTQALLVAFFEAELKGLSWSEPWLQGAELLAWESAGLVEAEWTADW